MRPFESENCLYILIYLVPIYFLVKSSVHIFAENTESCCPFRRRKFAMPILDSRFWFRKLQGQIFKFQLKIQTICTNQHTQLGRVSDPKTMVLCICLTRLGDLNALKSFGWTNRSCFVGNHEWSVSLGGKFTGFWRFYLDCKYYWKATNHWHFRDAFETRKQ